jgi:hypothetical protein
MCGGLFKWISIQVRRLGMIFSKRRIARSQRATERKFSIHVVCVEGECGGCWKGGG